MFSIKLIHRSGGFHRNFSGRHGDFDRRLTVWWLDPFLNLIFFGDPYDGRWNRLHVQSNEKLWPRPGYFTQITQDHYERKTTTLHKLVHGSFARLNGHISSQMGTIPNDMSKLATSPLTPKLPYPPSLYLPPPGYLLVKEKDMNRAGRKFIRGWEEMQNMSMSMQNAAKKFGTLYT